MSRSASDLIVAWAGGLVLSVGVAVLSGWGFDVDSLNHVLPGFLGMTANTALGLVVAAVVLLLGHFESRTALQRIRPRILRVSLAAALVLLGAATLFQYLAGVGLGIDELIVRDPAGGDFPGRMSAVSAACFLIFGLAELSPRSSARTATTALLTAGLVLATLTAVGYLYRARLLADPPPSTAIALHASVAFIVLFLGGLASRARHGWLAALFRDDSLGHVMRTTIPSLILVPLLVGWLGLLGLQLGIYGPRGLMAWFVTVTIATLCMLTLWTSQRAARMEKTLADQQALHAAVLRNALDAFVLIDDHGMIREWNDQAERIFGWTRREVLGARLEEFVIPEGLRERHRTGLRRFLDTGEGPAIGSRLELTALRRNGDEFPVELMIVPLRVEGTYRFGGFARDLSLQRETEQQLRQAQKMEAIGHLTGGIAHDFNNLLTVVIGDIEMEMARNPAAGERLARPLQAAERGASLIVQLLAFARRQHLQPEPIDIDALLTEVQDILRGALRDDIELHLRPSAGTWRAFADRHQLESALINLAVNARDAMPEGGRLTIQTGNVALPDGAASAGDGFAGGDYVALEVTDTGVGMTDEVVRHAMEPFFTTKDAGKGSGLGLSMVYGFARQSNGLLEIDSAPGSGTRVRLLLPRAVEEASTAHSAAAAAPTGEPESTAGPP